MDATAQDRDRPGDGPDGARAVPRGVRVVVPVLALTALGAALTAAAAVVLVLSGGVDEQYFASYTSDGAGNETSFVDPGVDLAYRWEALRYIVPADQRLLGPVLLVAVLAALHVAGHRFLGAGRPTVPRGARVVAVAAAVVSTLLVVATVGVPAVLRHSGGSDVVFPDRVPALVDVAAPVALSAVQVLLAVASAVLLLGRPLAGPGHDEPDDEPDEGVDAAGGGGTVPAVGTAARAPEPAPEPAPAEPPPVPRLAEEDRALYRRPTP
ncbi:hypothetical protein AB2L27_07020 [Kineococcus sp. LSe6-4]|uniref:Uncharacterized protein n=1 Tax=Kineococcus halophytocola TaxID=3234027 RepID=A0ABV4GYX3_9ACTN